MNEKMVTLDEVSAAFDTLLEVMARECGRRKFQTALFVKADVMDILAGTWRDRAAEERAAAVEPEEGPNVARCAACGQSLGDIRRSMFACPECYAAFGDEAVEAAMPF